MERLNLNIAEDTRKQLKAMAKRLKVTESELARNLLTDALHRARKEEIYREVAAAMTPEIRRAMIEFGKKWERINDDPPRRRVSNHAQARLRRSA